jgi:hypothetical protein
MCWRMQRYLSSALLCHQHLDSFGHAVVYRSKPTNHATNLRLEYHVRLEYHDHNATAPDHTTDFKKRSAFQIGSSHIFTFASAVHVCMLDRCAGFTSQCSRRKSGRWANNSNAATRPAAHSMTAFPAAVRTFRRQAVARTFELICGNKEAPKAVWPVVVRCDAVGSTEPCLGIIGMPPAIGVWAAMTETHVAAAVKNCCGLRTSADRVMSRPMVDLFLAPELLVVNA